MNIIQTITVLAAYAVLFGTMLIARVDYRATRGQTDWDAR